MSKVGAVILAAGMSKRMGEPKIFVDFHGKPLFLHSVECALHSDLSPILIVGGEHTVAIREHTKELPIKIIDNPNYQDGIATSLKLGIEAMKHQVDAVMVFLADQPFLPPMLIERLLQYYQMNQEKGIRIVRPRYSGVPGHPVLIDAEIFSEFFHLMGDEGGRSIIKKHQQELMVVDVENPIWGVDLDTPDDVKKYKNIFPILNWKN